MIVREMFEEDFQRIIEISDKELGTGSVDYDTLNTVAFGFVVEEQRQIIGFGVNTILETRELDTYLKDHLVKFSPDSEIFGEFETCAVDRNYQKMGVGGILYNARMKKLEEIGVDVVYSTAWENKVCVNSAKLLERHGLRKIAVIPDYWDTHMSDCPGCEGYPCSCNAILYAKTSDRYSARPPRTP